MARFRSLVELYKRPVVVRSIFVLDSFYLVEHCESSLLNKKYLFQILVAS